MKKSNTVLAAVNVALLFFMCSCSNGIKKKSDSAFYTLQDYYDTEKYDVHVHVNTNNPYFIEHSKKDNFRLLSVNVNADEYMAIDIQQEFATYQLKAFPERIAYATTFKVDTWNNDEWLEKTLSYLSESFKKGAIAVKVWKNIGMELKDNQGKFVMIDDPRFDPVFDFLQKNNITLIGHIGEPKNCWLPLEKMTVKGDKNYFSTHPEYHMYLHPEYPSYEDLIKARDHVLEKHPGLLFVGAHLGSLEWSVDELAKRLDKYPNMAVDMAERVSHLQYSAVTDWQKVHDFCVKYQDRLLYGTDIEVNDSKDSLEVINQAHERRIKHWQFFTSNEMMKVPKVDGEFKGLHLSRKVVDKIYRKNAEKWFPGLKNKGK